MKKYITEKSMTNATDGYMLVVVEGETHLNRMVIKSDIQFFTDSDHPVQEACQNAQFIAEGLNQLEELKRRQNKRYPDYATDAIRTGKYWFSEAQKLEINEVLGLPKENKRKTVN